TGTNFDTKVPGNNKVSFNGTSAIITQVTATTIVTTVPLGATTGPITVSTLGGSAISAVPFTVIASQDFSIQAAPSLASVIQGKSVSYLMSLTSIGQGNLTNLVGLSTIGLPTGVTAAFNPVNISISQNASFILTASATTTAGNYTVTINGSASIGGQTVTRSATTQLSVIASGGTTLSGRILASKDDAPIQGAILTLGSQTATTDASGNFLLSSVPTGSQVLVVSGPTAIYPTLIPVPVMITAGTANDMPYPIYLQEVSTQYTSFTPGVATTINPPNIADMSIYIPQGTYIIGADGQPNTKMSAVPVPVDRLPLPPVPATSNLRTIYMFNFAKPGGGIPTVPIPIVYPNDLGGEPGEKLDLWYYDESMTPNANSNQWKIYGTGTVSQDAKTIAPDPGVGQPKFCCGAGGAARRNPPTNPGPRDSDTKKGEPVDVSTGLYVIDKTDQVLPGILPIAVSRSYRTILNNELSFSGSFGLGWSFNYDQTLRPSSSLAMLYIMPDGGRYTLSQQVDGTYANTAYPFLRGVVVTRKADGTTQMRQRDGSLQIFNSAGFLIEQRDRNNNSIFIARDSYNRVTQISDPSGRALTIGYNSTNGLIASVTDPIGRVVLYGYDTSNRLSTVTDPAGGVTTYTYNTNNRIATITDPKGITFITNSYDANGRVAKQVLADGGINTLTYTLAGGLVTQTAMTDSMGNTTTYRFNSRGYMPSIVNAQGQVIRFDRDFSTNLLNASYDSLNRKTSFTYDLNGNTTSIIDSEGNPTLFEYEQVYNKVTKITDAQNHVTSFSYDLNGNLVSTTDPLGNKTSIAYNLQGQPVSVTDVLNNTTQFVYDTYGNLVTTIDPLGNQTSRYYDLVSRLINLTDATGKTVQYGYDPLNRVTQITDAVNGITAFSYDPNGNVLSITDAKGNTTSNTYDVQDRLATRKDPLLRTESFVYDLNGNLIKATDRKGQITTFSYDSLEQRTSTSFADGSSINLIYDGAGRILSINDTVSGPIQYAYDNLDRMISETTPVGQITYAYDILGRRVSMAANGQTPVNYTYNANSRLTAVAQGAQTVSLNYDVLGRRTSLVYPNGTQATYAYDAASRITGISHQAGATNIENLTYSYDSAGNQISLTRGNSAATNLPTAVQAAYDVANEQVRFNSSTPNLTYDANGNLISDGTKTYTWNARNQLIVISGNVSASFSYDALGRRISKTINGTRTDYQYDGDDIVAEIGGGAVGATYVRSLSIDEPFARITSAGVEYYHTDALGSVFALTNASGITTATYTYDPFGNTTQTGISSNPFQYSGREQDGTGLYFYRARYYSPALQRFISEDPIGFAGGDLNLYESFLNNPINFKDYTGNGPVGQVVGAVIGGFVGYDVGIAVGAGVGATIGTFALPGGGTLGGAVAGGVVGAAVGTVTGTVVGAAIGDKIDDAIRDYIGSITYFGKQKGERNWDSGKGDDPYYDKDKYSNEDLKKIERDKKNYSREERKRAQRARKQREKKEKCKK
ncbi:MAG: hypothetical protein HY036_06640, partial [Nitrospirae bacterium]|nr:hypothetical protein [Nitrospirota bacterium]